MKTFPHKGAVLAGLESPLKAVDSGKVIPKNVSLVITNAGGYHSDVSKKLKERGIKFKDVTGKEVRDTRKKDIKEARKAGMKPGRPVTRPETVKGETGSGVDSKPKPATAGATSKAPPSDSKSAAAKPAKKTGGSSMKGGGRASFSKGKIRISSSGAWSFAGKAGTGASAALGVWGALSTIDGAMAQLEKARTGSVAPEVARAIKVVKKKFPTAEEVKEEVLWYGFDSEKNYPKAKKWLHENGVRALMEKGTSLDTMGYHLGNVLDYANDLEKLGDEYKNYRDNIDPLLNELKKRTGVLYDIVHDLEELLPYMPSSTAQLTLWDVRTTFWNAARDLGKLEGVVSRRHWGYDRGYREAWKHRREAAELFNYWARAYGRIWKEETGKTTSRDYIPID